MSIEDLEARIVDVERKYETLRLAVLEWGKGFDTHGRLIDKLWQRIEALDATQQPPLFTAEEVARIVAPSSPADSLLDRVAKALYDAPSNHEGWRSEARAAILEVAAAALQMHPDKNLTWERVALWLEQEANQ